MAPACVALQTTWHSRNGRYVLRPVAAPHAKLAALLALYRDGLHRPLHFFPKAAWRYAANRQSMAKARDAWQSSKERPFGEDRDPAYRLALRGVEDPFDDAFTVCAATVFEPLLAVIEDGRLG